MSRKTKQEKKRIKKRRIKKVKIIKKKRNLKSTISSDISKFFSYDISLIKKDLIKSLRVTLVFIIFIVLLSTKI
jgi:hypothetical protein